MILKMSERMCTIIHFSKCWGTGVSVATSKKKLSLGPSNVSLTSSVLILIDFMPLILEEMRNRAFFLMKRLDKSGCAFFRKREFYLSVARTTSG